MITHYRRGTADENAMREVRSYFRIMGANGLSLAGKRVLDIGAHIGCFTRAALDAGADRVLAFEPHPKNYELLTMNCQDARADLRQAALVSDNRTETSLVVGRRHNPDVGTERFSTSRRQKGNLHVATVECQKFSAVLRDFNPQVIKLDAEGAEYDLLNSQQLPDDVEFLVGEFDCSGSFRLPDGGMTGTVGLKNYEPLWALITNLEKQRFRYIGRTDMRLPKKIFLIHVLFIKIA